MKFFVSDFHRQMFKATEILTFDWLRANLSVKISDKMLHEMLPRCHTAACDNNASVVQEFECLGQLFCVQNLIYSNMYSCRLSYRLHKV